MEGIKNALPSADSGGRANDARRRGGADEQHREGRLLASTLDHHPTSLLSYRYLVAKGRLPRWTAHHRRLATSIAAGVPHACLPHLDAVDARR